MIRRFLLILLLLIYPTVGFALHPLGPGHVLTNVTDFGNSTRGPFDTTNLNQAFTDQSVTFYDENDGGSDPCLECLSASGIETGLSAGDTVRVTDSTCCNGTYVVVGTGTDYINVFPIPDDSAGAESNVDVWEYPTICVVNTPDHDCCDSGDIQSDNLDYLSYSTENGLPVVTGGLETCVEWNKHNKIILPNIAGEIVMDGRTWDGGQSNNVQGLGIYGQTAPAPGINVADVTFHIRGDDIVIQHLRFQNRDTGGHNPPGDNVTARDCIVIDDTFTPNNLVLDHLSVRWCPDGTIDGGDADGSWTVTHSLLYEPLRFDVNDRICDAPGDPLTCCMSCLERAKLALLRADDTNIFWHRNVMAMADARTPRFTGNSGGETMTVILAESYIYGPQIWNVALYSADGDMRAAVIGNQVVKAATTNKTYAYDHIPGFFYAAECNPPANYEGWGASSEFYFIDNLTDDGNTIDDATNWDHREDFTPDPPDCDDPDAYKIVASPAWLPTGWTPYTIDSVDDFATLKAILLANVGARPAERGTANQDDDDYRVITEVSTGSGDSIKRCVKQGADPCDTGYVHDDSGNYPDFGSADAIVLDLPSDPYGDTDNDGYTNLEEWLHSYADYVQGAAFVAPIITAPTVDETNWDYARPDTMTIDLADSGRPLWATDWKVVLDGDGCGGTAQGTQSLCDTTNLTSYDYPGLPNNTFLTACVRTYEIDPDGDSTCDTSEATPWQTQNFSTMPPQRVLLSPLLLQIIMD